MFRTDFCVAQNENALLHRADLRNIAVDTIDYDGAGHAVERLLVALAVRMRVIPVEARRLI
jgi:hypothetical protein